TNDFSTIAIVLSEPIDPQSATNVANYVFSPAITVLSAEAVGPNMVKLTISGFDVQFAYSISARGVGDLALPPNQMDGSGAMRVQISLDVPSAGLLAVQTAFVIVMENQDWAAIQGNTNCPYINNVILPMASYCKQFYTANDLHPSEPNYLWMEAGTNFGILDDQPPSSHRLSSTNHLVTLLNNAGISWKSYQEDMPAGCPTNSVFPYLARHDPFVFFDDVTTDMAYCTNHIRPFSELGGDLASDTVARYNFITPNQTNDMHDLAAGSTSQAGQGDAWLSRQLPVILNSPSYTNNGAIFILWDEGNPNGPIGMMVLSPQAKGGGYFNSVRYNHSSLLRSLQEIFQVRPFLGNAAFANTLSDLFIGLTLSASQSNGTVNITINNALPGRTNYLQASSDLLNWSTIRTNIGTSSLTVTDPQATSHQSRFYRVLQMP
ncbi:MAG TPA: alkaline phosphatase family protein, partial [Verrucomicrobiae bacterium]|nr:alkaline phosphatase family protein [Verrucomicrobiae bacterium]